MKRLTTIIIAVLCAGIMTAQARGGNLLYDGGYQGYVDVSVGYHSNNSGMQTSLLTSHGYSTGFGLYAGLGTGIEYACEYDKISLPLFLDLKYSFQNRDFSPYVAMKTGVSVRWGNTRCGAYIAPSVGVDVKKHLSFFLKYDYSSLYTATKIGKHAFSVGIAVGF